MLSTTLLFLLCNKREDVCIFLKALHNASAQTKRRETDALEESGRLHGVSDIRRWSLKERYVVLAFEPHSIAPITMNDVDEPGAALNTC